MVESTLANKSKIFAQSCSKCGLSNNCLPAAFNEDVIENLEKIVTHGKSFPNQKVIFQQGEPFHSLFVVKSGAVKTYIYSTDGLEHITGIYLRGEMFGLESISSRIYLNTAESLSDSKICKINYQSLADLRKKIPELSDLAVNILSNNLAADHNFFNCLTNSSPISRLASFLLLISRRYDSNGQYQLDFELPMSRQDIGNYLGLATPTISRAFTKLVNEKYIEKKNRKISIINLTKLEACSTLDVASEKIRCVKQRVV